MPPKIRITKESIVATAVDLVRRDGAGAINARTIAKELSCSTQPVFSNFATMDELRLAVVNAADTLYREYTEQEVASGKYPVYKATGMAYIRFAKEEKELFKLLFMRDRSAEQKEVETEDTQKLFSMVENHPGIAGNNTKLFHLEMWAYVHGIATMMATNYFEIDTDLISEMLTDAFQGLKRRYEAKE